jgi:hypothetical protein
LSLRSPLLVGGLRCVVERLRTPEHPPKPRGHPYFAAPRLQLSIGHCRLLSSGSYPRVNATSTPRTGLLVEDQPFGIRFSRPEAGRSFESKLSVGSSVPMTQCKGTAGSLRGPAARIAGRANARGRLQDGRRRTQSPSLPTR